MTQVQNIIINTDGVISLRSMQFSNLFGEIDGRNYSGSIFNLASNTKDNIVIAPEGSIFEIRFPNSDIVGNAT